jgi:hypothetical protein
MHGIKLPLLIAFVLSAPMARAQAMLTALHGFTTGQPISSAQVNENFGLLQAALLGGAAGQVLTSSGGGNAPVWTAPLLQPLTLGTAGTAPAVTAAGGGHIINLPIASSTNTGLLASADWNLFNNKLSLAGGVLTGPLTLSGPPAEPNHAASKAYVDGNLFGFPIMPSAPTMGQVLQFNGSQWAPASVAGGTGFNQNGNFFGMAAYLGTNDPFDLHFLSAGMPRARFRADNGALEFNYTPGQPTIIFGNSMAGPPPAGISTFPMGGGSRILTGSNITLDPAGIPWIPHGGYPHAGVMTTEGDVRVFSGFGSPQERLTILNNGHVGIGTALPNKNLEVVGQQHVVTEIRTLSPGFDAVLVLSTPSLGFHSISLEEANGGGLHIRNNGSDRMVIHNNGNVGVGTASPIHKLDVNGSLGAQQINSGQIVTNDLNTSNVGTSNIVANGGTITLFGNLTATGEITWTSDHRLKEKLTPLTDSLAKLGEIKGYRYYWKDRKVSTREKMGLIAQEVEAVFPQAVHTNDKGIKSVAYSVLIAPLIEAVKELDREIQSLKRTSRERTPASELASLKQENVALRAYLCEKDPAAPFCQ